jgi:hypothetical protein
MDEVFGLFATGGDQDSVVITVLAFTLSVAVEELLGVSGNLLQGLSSEGAADVSTGTELEDTRAEVLIGDGERAEVLIGDGEKKSELLVGDGDANFELLGGGDAARASALSASSSTERNLASTVSKLFSAAEVRGVVV